MLDYWLYLSKNHNNNTYFSSCEGEEMKAQSWWNLCALSSEKQQSWCGGEGHIWECNKIFSFPSSSYTHMLVRRSHKRKEGEKIWDIIEKMRIYIISRSASCWHYYYYHYTLCMYVPPCPACLLTYLNPRASEKSLPLLFVESILMRWVFLLLLLLRLR